MQDQAQQILDKCKEMVVKARELYGLDLSKVLVRFDLRGRAAGQAYRKLGHYGVRFNRDMLTRDAFDHLLNNTVPHEFAHIICFMNPSLGRDHDTGWARVCSQLGGEAKRFHKEEVVYGKGITYEYTTTKGHKVRVSQQIHKKIHSGATYTYRGGKGAVNMFCAHSIVGVSGRTLQAPIIKQAPNHPDQIEMARRQAMVDALREQQRRAAAMVQAPTIPAAATFNSGESKANVARAIMLSGYRAGKTADQIIEAIMFANGHTKQLATAYFKNNVGRVGIPADYV